MSSSEDSKDNSYMKHNDNSNKCKEFLATQRLGEKDVGITEYISPNIPGFSGIIKARFSDFHVHEINNANEIAKLTDLTIPPEYFVDNEEEKPTPSLETLISEDFIKQLHEMVASEEDLKLELDGEKYSKEERCLMYDGIRAVFGNKVVANTINVDGKKVMFFKKYTKESNVVDSRKKWPSHIGEYVYFIVYKESLDTLEACFKLADCIKRNPHVFSYAGVKDRRAKTTQWFCAYKLDPTQLFAKTKPLMKIHVGNISFHEVPLKLGQLKGNYFKVALRNITADDNIINDAMESLKSLGFINYFGLQRFGNDKEVPTYEVGVKLLQGKFKEACDLILKCKTSDNPLSEIAQAKRVFSETNNSQLAANKFKRLRNKCVESRLLLGFVKHNSNNFVNALENIPRNMRLLYIHAFQSLVWNTMVSLRIKKFGLVPIPGDIVLLKDSCNDVDGDDNNIKILTKDDLANYSVYDLVMPLPGFDVKYPDNDLKEDYKDMLANYNLTLEMPKQSVKTYSLSGAYRKIVCKVSDASWKTMHYNHPDDTLIRSDYEELQGDQEPQDQPNGQYKALIVEFSLPSSSYATMALREILKMDTSSTAQAKLNKYHTPAVARIPDSLETSTDEVFATSNSLLTDADKYEEFKRQVFGTEFESKESSKRKVENEEAACKKMKTDADQT